MAREQRFASEDLPYWERRNSTKQELGDEEIKAMKPKTRSRSLQRGSSDFFLDPRCGSKEIEKSQNTQIRRNTLSQNWEVLTEVIISMQER